MARRGAASAIIPAAPPSAEDTLPYSTCGDRANRPRNTPTIGSTSPRVAVQEAAVAGAPALWDGSRGPGGRGVLADMLRRHGPDSPNAAAGMPPRRLRRTRAAA
ncbi:hypothetical protein KRMM14A1259_17770 [Krasilnikovia sp. MM14-A1259]